MLKTHSLVFGESLLYFIITDNNTEQNHSTYKSTKLHQHFASLACWFPLSNFNVCLLYQSISRCSSLSTALDLYSKMSAVLTLTHILNFKFSLLRIFLEFSFTNLIRNSSTSIPFMFSWDYCICHLLIKSKYCTAAVTEDPNLPPKDSLQDSSTQQLFLQEISWSIQEAKSLKEYSGK